MRSRHRREYVPAPQIDKAVWIELALYAPWDSLTVGQKAYRNVMLGHQEPAVKVEA